MQQRDEDPATRATQRMAQRNGATTRVHVVVTQSEDLAVGFDDGCECLVEFPHGDIGFGEAGLLEELLDDSGGRDGEVDRVCSQSVM